MFAFSSIFYSQPMSAKPEWEQETDVLTEIADDVGEPAQIVVWNDDVNSFEWVIECFVKILSHTFEQAEQLSIIIHTKGKAIVKSGPRDVLKPMCEALQERGLSAEMDSTSR